MSERVLNDEMYVYRADAQRYLDQHKGSGDWDVIFAARVVWLVDELESANRRAKEAERKRELEGEQWKFVLARAEENRGD